jgi:GTPase SAR1 family protein
LVCPSIYVSTVARELFFFYFFITNMADITPAPFLPSTASLDQFQTEEQRHVLDTVAQIRKCGLEGVLSLPQLVVCGDQSAGKSSVLEALTEIPFPRNDNLCTRFATEITLRRAPSEALSVCIIPADTRPASEQAKIKAFSETIHDFGELPTVMDMAMSIMGLDITGSDGVLPPAFARDVLSIEIEGPTRPQLTLVDVPGLIQTETKGVTKQDREMVADITDFYIQQPRTICLAVISAANDYANQPILTKVREVDPEGERTLGIITKPDRLDHGAGMEAAFIELAQNKDIFFKLGWHVLKNREFKEMDFSINERNMSESAYFNKSNFKVLSPDCVGIDALRARLSHLLFDHVKHELPSLRQDLDNAMTETSTRLEALGAQRVTAADCRNYLTMLSLDCLETTKAAVDGHYEGLYFQSAVNDQFSVDSSTSIRRFRAMIQFLNHRFEQTMRERGAKYILVKAGAIAPSTEFADNVETDRPRRCTRTQLLDWVGEVLIRCRGKEPVGNYNPLIIGELFWEQSSRWQLLAEEHIEQVARVCHVFLNDLLGDKCPKDVHSRLIALNITSALKARREKAQQELRYVVEDNQEFPAVYNHYYTDTVQKSRNDRKEDALTESVKDAVSHHINPGCRSDHNSAQVDVVVAVRNYADKVQRDMERHSCEEALDYLLAMYKVSNTLTQGEVVADERPSSKRRLMWQISPLKLLDGTWSVTYMPYSLLLPSTISPIRMFFAWLLSHHPSEDRGSS